MKTCLLTGYELASGLLPCAALYAVYGMGRSGTTRRIRMLLGMAMLYLALVLHVTGAGTLYNGIQFGMVGQWQDVNLLPFSRTIDPVGYVLNIVLFVPFGMLMPMLGAGWDKLGRVAAAGLVFSLLIELSQLLNLRSTDVDDLVMNTLGAVLGYAVWRLLFRARCQADALAGRERRILLLCAAAVLLGRFLLFDELSAAGLLYGF